MIQVFINGGSGTTGLRIAERLQARPDIELLTLPEERRKLVAAQAELAAQADITFLCLPDEASRALIALLPEGEGRVLDASTAFRTDARFAYGFPELSPAHEAALRTARRVAVPGCHASGAIALLYPLLQAGIIAPDMPVSLTSLTGYSGGGKAMIAEYENPARAATLAAPRPYAVSQNHKHLPEIQHVCGLAEKPIFTPIVADYDRGMVVTAPLHRRLLAKPAGLAALTEVYRAHYAGQPLVSVLAPNAEPFIAANALAGTDAMQVWVCGNEERLTVCARFDNLGKGAGGAALACMNLMLGLPLQTGLIPASETPPALLTP